MVNSPVRIVRVGQRSFGTGVLGQLAGRIVGILVRGQRPGRGTAVGDRRHPLSLLYPQALVIFDPELVTLPVMPVMSLIAL